MTEDSVVTRECADRAWLLVGWGIAFSEAPNLKEKSLAGNNF
jgi:hypothetical protein